MIKQVFAAEEPLGVFDSGTGFLDTRPLNVLDSSGINNQFSLFATTFFGFLTIVAGLAFILYFVLGAVQWIVAGGEPGKIETARNQMVNAAIGLVAVIAAYTITGIIGMILGINILDPSQALEELGPGGSQAPPNNTGTNTNQPIDTGHVIPF